MILKNVDISLYDRIDGAIDIDWVINGDRVYMDHPTDGINNRIIKPYISAS